MARLTEEEQRALAGEFLAAVKRLVPEWTNPPDSDPGVTLLELFAWLLDNLQFEQATPSDRKRAALRQVLEKLSAFSRDSCTSKGGLTRPRYFTGKLLTEGDFQGEQDYVREKMRRHNRCLFGFGVVTGLQVTLESNSETNEQLVVTVSPGCAIDANGEQITVCEPLRCTLPTRISAGYVIARYFEQAVDPLPTVVDGSIECSRIQEGVAVEFEQNMPTDGVALAHLEQVDGKWRLDLQFRCHTITLAR
jgi:hypothetical protein